MDQTKTSFANNRPDAGLTLLEMLVALMIAATLASFVALSLSGTRQARSLDEATTQLASDLRAARNRARDQGQVVELTPGTEGYVIEALSLERSWADGLVVHWIEDDRRSQDRVGAFLFQPHRLAQTGLVVVIEDGAQRTRQVEVEAVTGRINAQ